MTAGLVIAAGLVVVPTTTAAEAAIGSEFDPGNIISDAVFYDAASMNSGQIQAFIDGRVSACRSGYTCLESYRESTFTRAADSRCGQYNGVANQLASDIIYSVSQACGINPQVLIVLLQKEQGLVTSTAPTTKAYRAATGYGCPDTAACDTTYYGFYNQVYNAARQFKTYQALPNYWNYRAGRVNTINWHPNATCGTSPVYIENQATAALYIYTPYRPNAAALNNLYGSGDACSSYGNRNFWAYFSDWFGSPTGGGSIVKTANSATLYLTVGTNRYAINSIEVWEALAPLGPHRTVSQAALDSYTLGRSASPLVRDALNGDIFYVENGVKHKYPTCDLIDAYGMSCGEAIDLLPSQLRRYALGSEMTAFVKSASSPAVFYLVGGQKRELLSWTAVTALGGGQAPFIGTVIQSVLDDIPTGNQILAPGAFVKSATNATVWFIDGLSRKLALPSMGLGYDFGLPSVDLTTETVLARYATSPAPLTPLVICDGATYLANSGVFTPLSVPASEVGITPTPLDTITCSTRAGSGTAIVNSLFAKTAQSPTVYIMAGGTKRPVGSMAAVSALNMRAPASIVTLSQAVLDTFSTGQEALTPGTLVKLQTDPTIYMVDGLSKLSRVSSFDLAGDLGASGWATVSAATLGAYSGGTSELGIVITCPDGPFIGGSGALWKVSAAAVGTHPATVLDRRTCGALPIASATASAQLFAKAASSPTVFYIDAGKKRAVSSWAALMGLTGGTPPHIITMSAASISTIADGAPVE